ncbi:signal peptidase II [Candidatus Puniceispirillum sp.]|nr:signal peptidase II [Candidatus Puniceispirillum sp.]
MVNQALLPKPVDVSWFFIGEPVFNFGGFFVDGSEPTIYRLPSVMFLVWASIMLCRYLRDNRAFYQAFFAAILLGGVGGLTLDILAYGSICDWLGFKVLGASIYSMTNISDLMILVSAPFVAIICPKGLIKRSLSFCFAMAVIGSNTYYHVFALYEFLSPVA